MLAGAPLACPSPPQPQPGPQCTWPGVHAGPLGLRLWWPTAPTHPCTRCRSDKPKSLSRDERRRLVEVGRRAARSDVVRALAAEVAGAPEEERQALLGMDRWAGGRGGEAGACLLSS